jgi:hypothetical protein
VAAAVVAWIWWRDVSLPVRAAALLAGTLLAVPLSLFYDLMLAAVALAWLVRAERESGIFPGERLVFAAVYLVPMWSRGVGKAFHVPLGPLAASLLLAVCIARAVAEIRTRRANVLATKTLALQVA